MNDKDIFFTQMERVIPLLDDNQRKTEFVKAFCKKELGIDNIENSMISFEKMNSKVFFYLLLSLVIEYSDCLETHVRSPRDFFSSGESASNREKDN